MVLKRRWPRALVAALLLVPAAGVAYVAWLVLGELRQFGHELLGGCPRDIEELNAACASLDVECSPAGPTPEWAGCQQATNVKLSWSGGTAFGGVARGSGGDSGVTGVWQCSNGTYELSIDARPIAEEQRAPARARFDAACARLATAPR